MKGNCDKIKKKSINVLFHFYKRKEKKKKKSGRRPLKRKESYSLKHVLFYFILIDTIQLWFIQVIFSFDLYKLSLVPDSENKSSVRLGSQDH